MSDVRAGGLTGGLDYDLADEIDGRPIERRKALSDPVRWLILDLVLERAMSVSELAQRIGKAKGTIAHHVDVLVDCGLLQVVRTRKVRAVEERFYGRAARTINEPHMGDGLPFLDVAAAEADYARMDDDSAGGCGFTLRHARIPAERADEWIQRLFQLAVEFSTEPREGDVEHALLIGVYPTTRSVAPRPRTPRTKGAVDADG